MMKLQGISLIEVLISLFLASLLTTAVMHHYLVSKREYLHKQNVLEQVFELQLVNDLVRNSIRSAGFTPCMGINSLQTLDRRNGRSGLSAIEKGIKKNGSLSINRMSEHFATVRGFINQTQLLLSPDVAFQKEDIIMIADCYHAEIHEVVNSQKTKAGLILTLMKPIVFQYVTPIYSGEWKEEVFFIKEDNQGYLALFYRNKKAEVLSSLINKMTVNLKSTQGQTLIQVVWGVKNTHPVTIETLVRAG